MNDARIWFADIEAYSLKYYKKYNDIKGYAFIQKDLDGNYLFDIDQEKFLDKVFAEPDPRQIIFYHNGGGYDWKFYLSSLSKRADKKTSHNFSYFAKDKKLFYMTYSIKTERYIRDTEGNLIPTGRKSNGKIQYKRKKYTKTFTFIDSYKHWPFPLSTIAKAVGLEKLDYGDYDITKEFNTNDEFIEWQDGKAWEYLHRDVDAPIKFYKETRELYDIAENYTLASSAFKDMCSENNNLRYSRRWLKDITIWKQIKTGFNGGFTWVNPIYQLLHIRNIYKYDVNSLYPYIMRHFALPFGEPIFEETDLKDRVRYYEVKFTSAKATSIPFMSKGKLDKAMEDITSRFLDEDWEEFSDLEEEYPTALYNQTRVMSSTLLEFFKKWYDIEDLEIRFLYEFKTRYDMFSGYIDKWTKIKVENDKKPALRLIAKLFQNATFGRFAMGIDFNKGIIDHIDTLIKNRATIKQSEKQLWVNGKTATELNDNYIFWKESQEVKEVEIKNREGEKEKIDDLSYIPIAEQITTLARIELLKPIMKTPELLVYCDTDSLHTLKPMDHNMQLHPTKLGAWKFEGLVETGIYRRPKHYLNIGIQEDNSYTGYMLKGGGFNVDKYNNEICLLPQTYLQETFTVEDGKKGKMETYGKPIIIGMDYTFTMPSWYKKYKEWGGEEAW